MRGSGTTAKAAFVSLAAPLAARLPADLFYQDFFWPRFTPLFASPGGSKAWLEFRKLLSLGDLVAPGLECEGGSLDRSGATKDADFSARAEQAAEEEELEQGGDAEEK